MVSGKPKSFSDSEETTSNKMMESSVIIRTCMDCSSTRTPLWRSGPAGPRSLCNACGIRHRKSKRDQICSDEKSKNKNKPQYQNKLKRKSRSGEKGVSLQMRVKGVGGRMRKLREEEEAAIQLMAMAYGYGSAKCI